MEFVGNRTTTFCLCYMTVLGDSLQQGTSIGAVSTESENEG